MENEIQTAAASVLAAAIVAELRRLHTEPQRVGRRAYSVAEAAQMLGVTEKSIRGCIDRGELATVEIGRHLRITEDSLNRFLRT